MGDGLTMGPHLIHCFGSTWGSQWNTCSSRKGLQFASANRIETPGKISEASRQCIVLKQSHVTVWYTEYFPSLGLNYLGLNMVKAKSHGPSMRGGQAGVVFLRTPVRGHFVSQGFGRASFVGRACIGRSDFHSLSFIFVYFLGDCEPTPRI